MRFRILLAAVLAAALLLQGWLIFQAKGVWWDEAVYQGLAQGLWQGRYSLDPGQAVESFRPPLYPLLLAAVPGQLLAVLLLAAAAGATALWARDAGPLPAILAPLFLATSFLFTFFATKQLTEPLFMALLALSLLALERAQGKGRWLLLAGALAGMAFLTRYLATVLVAGSVIAILLRRGRARQMVPYLAGVLLPLIPWMLFNQQVFGHPLGGYLLNLQVFAASAPAGALQDILLTFGALLPFLVLGLWRCRPLFRAHLPAVATLALAFLFYLAVPHREPRYLLSFLPAAALLAAVAAAEVLRTRARLPLQVLLLLLPLATLLLGAQAAWLDAQETALVDAARFLGEVGSPGETVLTQSYPFVYAFSSLQAVPYCGWDAYHRCQAGILQGAFPAADLEATLAREQPAFALSSAFEPANPPEARALLEERFARLRAFPAWGNPEAVIVYQARDARG